MDTIKFAQLPVLVKFTALLSLFLAWVAFAEFVIDRHGLDRFLPFYKVGNICPYEFLVAAILTGTWIVLHKED